MSTARAPHTLAFENAKRLMISVRSTVVSSAATVTIAAPRSTAPQRSRACSCLT